MIGKSAGRIGLVAVVALAPGGFILGAVLAARHYRNRRSRAAPVPPAPVEPTAEIQPA